MRQFLPLFIIGVFLTVQPGIAEAQSENPDASIVITDPDSQPDLADLIWKSRPVVVFADSTNDPRFVQQLEMLTERTDELADRDVWILTDTDPAAKGPLRTELRPRGFGLVIVDKDGSIVQRRPSPTTSRELINLIDRLPSRRQETGSFRQ